MEISARHHLRADQVDALRETIESRFGATLDGESFEAVSFTSIDDEFVLVDGEPTVLRIDGSDPILTVRGANAFEPDRRIVVVDAGAVSFVSDGADVMRPGIVEADEAIAPDEYVLIAEETHRKVLAVGRARVAGGEMLGEQGKVVDSIHHVGDEWYTFTP